MFCTPVATYKSRKNRQCEWCLERIHPGDLYMRYRYYNSGDAQTIRLHPECYEAMVDYAKEEGGFCEWTPGMDRPTTNVKVME